MAAIGPARERLFFYPAAAAASVCPASLGGGLGTYVHTQCDGGGGGPDSLPSLWPWWIKEEKSGLSHKLARTLKATKNLFTLLWLSKVKSELHTTGWNNFP